MHKKALVTGASRGIGLAIAESLAAQGYDLVLTCIHSIDSLQMTAKELSGRFPVSCSAMQGDMGSYEDVCRIFRTLNQLDLLVNNAGISHIGLFTEMSPDEWHRVMAVNLDSCFYTCRQAARLMLPNHTGRIINISSVWGSAGASMETAYSASKGALNSFTRALAKELAPSHIPVNAIACGLIDTDMNRCFTQEELEAVIREIPADRMGTVQEVAQLTSLLAQAPEYMTGQVINIDGGWI